MTIDRNQACLWPLLCSFQLRCLWEVSRLQKGEELGDQELPPCFISLIEELEESGTVHEAWSLYQHFYERD